MGRRKKPQEAPPVKVRRYRDWTILRRIFAFVFPYKWEVIKLVFLSIINSLIGLAYPVGVMFIMSELTATYSGGAFISDPARFTNILIVGLSLLGVMVLAFYLKRSYIYKMSFLGQSAMLDIRRSLFDNLQILSLNYYVERPAGKIMSSVTNDVDAVSNLISNAIIQIVGDIFTVVSSIVAMLLISFTLSITILILIPVGFIIMFFFAKKSRKYFRQSRETISNITSNLQETISGSRTIKAFVTEDENIEIFKELNEADKIVNLSAARLNAFVGPIVQVLIVLAMGIILYVGGQEVQAGRLAIPGMIGYFLFASSFGGPFGNVSQFYNHIQLALAAGERILTIIDTKPDIVEKPAAQAQPLEARVAALEASFPDLSIPRNNQQSPSIEARVNFLKEKLPQIHLAPEASLETNVSLLELAAPVKKYAVVMPPIKGELEYRNVFFEYEKDVQVLKNINVKVHAGERVALVGFTGAGKSTFVNLLSRFYDPKQGAVLIDGFNLRDVTLGSLRSQMGIVLQDTFLFSGTVMDNIRYGRLEATDEEVIAAAKKVNAHEFILRLEDSYQTQVKERGSLLSVGQRQLISFARAILANPPILILDEATSSVDPYSELLIQQALEELLKNRTSFIVAHRLSTIINSDTILVMELGNIIQRGSHEELLAMGGLYKHLYEMQFKEPGKKEEDSENYKRGS